MYIEPGSIIRLLKGVPLDNSYSDTIYFESEEAQRLHFSTGYEMVSFTNQSYQRLENGTMMLEASADAIRDCNYIMFQNVPFGGKWFYGFISGIEYVNNETARVSFEIDVMQSYFFDYALEPSYVEREHSATDVIGDNILPEPFDIGPIICTSQNKPSMFDGFRIVLGAVAE